MRTRNASTLACALIAKYLKLKKKCLILIAAAGMSPISPIGVKKRLRCPGARKLLASIKNLENCGECFRSETIDEREIIDSKCITNEFQMEMIQAPGYRDQRLSERR